MSKKVVNLLFAFFFISYSTFSQTHLPNPIPITVHINSGNPKFPFPQFLDYKGGKTLGRQNPIGVTDIEMEKTIREAYQIMMNRANYTGEEQDGVKYIEFNSKCKCNSTCSEGDGYAMLAAAYMGDKKTFDGLWAFVHDHRLNLVKQYKNCSKTNRPNYKFGKYTVGNCASEFFIESNNDVENTAADGDWDVALAMLVAAKQWGKEKILTTQCGETVTYHQEAVNVIKALTDTIFQEDGSNPQDPRNNPYGGVGYSSGVIGFDGYPKDGNNTGELTDWISNNSNPPHNKGYLWQGKTLYAKNLYPTAKWLDYIAPSYYRAFADFLSEIDPVSHAWNIHQFKRAEASTDWIMGQIHAQNKFPTGGIYSLSGTTLTIGEDVPAEDARNPWRTIMNYVWNGNPTTKWNPLTHEVEAGGNTYEYDNAIKLATHVQFKDGCLKLGNDPTDLEFKGVSILGEDIDAFTGENTGGVGKHLNWLYGTISPSIVAYHQKEQSKESFDQLADWYNRLVLLWDGDALNPSDPMEDQKYIRNLPVFFHGWFRLLGLLVTTGNYHSPAFMGEFNKANLKIYNSVDKTVAYAPVTLNGIIKTPGDLITYKLSYRNFSSTSANNVTISFPLPPEVEFVSATQSGSISGSAVNWTISSIPGYTSTNESGQEWKSFDPKKYPTYGEVSVTVRVKQGIKNIIICPQATISATNSESYTSNEYPNNETPTMERNCVDILERNLTIAKTSDKVIAKNGDVVNFTINFENSSKTGWINGGRPDVRITYANGFAGDNTAICFFRFLHGAHEPYLNPGNYRVSYFVNDAARLGIYHPTNNRNGWDLKTTILEGGDPNKVYFSSEQYTLGEDNFGKWNQRLIIRFADTLVSTTQHTNMFFSKPGEVNKAAISVHKGIGNPFRMAVQMEAKGSSSACGSIPIKSLLTDDWSYTKDLDIGTNDKHLFFPISPSWFNYQSTYDSTLKLPLLDVHVDACKPNYNKNFERLLVEEFDGFIWRRILGNGPTPGIEVKNVLIRDTLPEGFTWNGFTQSETLGIKASYNPTTRVIEYMLPAMLPGSTGTISYSAVALSDCSSDKVIVNRAWISSASSSPIDSSIKITITCKPIPPLPPAKTTMYKFASKTFVDVQDPINYKISYKQTQGTIASPSLNSTDNWTIHCGEQMFNFNDTRLPGDNPKLATYDFSHGRNGTLITKIGAKTAQPFSLIFRYNGNGSPKCTTIPYQGLLLSFVNNSCAQLAVNLIQNGTKIGGLTDIAYAAPQDTLTIKIKLDNDKLYLWINNFNSLPYVFDKITYLDAGYVGYFNSNELANSNESHKILSWNTNFDSAFEVKLWDKIPAELSFNPSSIKKTYTTPGFTPVNNDPIVNQDSIIWKLVSGKTPMLYGDSVAFEFESTVKDCGPGFITNIAYADILGQPKNKIGAQSVTTCGTPPPPTCQIQLTPGANVNTCPGQKAVLQASATVDNPPAYQYQWYKKTAGVDPAKYVANYAPFTINMVAIADTGEYVLRVTSTTDPTCFKEVTVKLSITSGAAASITAPADSIYETCADSVTLTAQPAGTGVWSIRAGDAGTIDATKGVVKGFSATAFTRVYYIVRGSANCPASQDSVDIKKSATSTKAKVKDQSKSLCENAPEVLGGITLQGNEVVAPEKGEWFAVDATTIDRQTGKTGPLSIGRNAFIYSITNPGCGSLSSGDTVFIQVDAKPAKPNAGVDKDICTEDFKLEGQNVAGQLLWSTPQAGVTFENDTLYNSVAKGLPLNQPTTFILSATRGACKTAVTDTVVITSKGSVTIANVKAQSDTLCQGVEPTLLGNQLKSDETALWRSLGLAQITQDGKVAGLQTGINQFEYAVTSSNPSCPSTTKDTVTITVQPSIVPEVSIKTPKTQNCLGTPVTLHISTLSPNTALLFAYQWKRGSQKIANATDSVYSTATWADGEAYTVTIYKKTGTALCLTADSAVSTPITLTATPVTTPTVSIIATPATPVCEGDTVLFRIGAQSGDGLAPTYSWLVNNVPSPNTQPTFTLANWSNNTKVKLSMNSSESCVIPKTVESNELTLNGTARPINGFEGLQGKDEVFHCPGQEVFLTTLETNTSYTYKWKKNGRDTTVIGRTINAKGNSLYQVTITPQNGCATTSSIQVTETRMSVKIVAEALEFNPGKEIKVIANASGPGSEGDNNYEWSPTALFQPITGQHTSVFPKETGYIKVKVTTPEGCEAIDSLELKLRDKLFIPNALTFGTDDENGLWGIKGWENFPGMEVKVFNRWGSLVYEQKGYSMPWDGSYNGNPLPTGTYYYVIKHEKFEKPLVGDVTVVR